MEEKKIKKTRRKALSVMKWFQGSYLRMYSGLTFVWCTIIGFFFFLLAAIAAISEGENPFTILAVFPVSLLVGVGGALFMLVLSSEPLVKLDEKWRQAIVEERLPWWTGWIRLTFITGPYYFYGWVPQKAYDWYFHKFTNLFVGLRLAEEEKYREAIAELEQYKPSKSDVEENDTLYSTLGNCYIGIEEFDKAVASYQQAISFKPDDLRIQINLAQAYVLNNQHNEGLELLRKLHQMLPEDVEVLGIIARSYITLEMYDDALNYVKTACSLKPMEPVFHKMLAETYLGKDMKKEATESATKALSLNPSSIIAEEAQQIINITILQNEEQLTELAQPSWPMLVEPEIQKGIQKLKKEYPGFFEQLSPQFLEFILSEETSFKIEEICLENGVEDEEKIEKIAYRVTLALLNQVPKENLAEILEKGVDLNSETAEKISIEIKRRIFSQAPEMLKKMDKI